MKLSNLTKLARVIIAEQEPSRKLAELCEKIPPLYIGTEKLKTHLKANTVVCQGA